MGLETFYTKLIKGEENKGKLSSQGEEIGFSRPWRERVRVRGNKGESAD
jgi:hypothetical protein